MRYLNVIGNILCAVLLCGICVLGLTGCGDSGPTSADVNSGPAPAPVPGGLAITTSSLPNGTVNQAYSASLGVTAKNHSLHVVRLSGPSKQSLVECVNGGDHWHAGCAGHDIAHVYASRQFDSFPKRSTNAQPHDRCGSGRVDDYHDITSGRHSRSILQSRRSGEWGDGSADLEPRRRGRDATARPEFEPDDRRD